MDFDLSKRNRLSGRFNFSLRDWQFELDGIDDSGPGSSRDRRKKSSTVLWERADSRGRREVERNHDGDGPR